MNSLGTVPAQENPTERIRQTSHFADPNYGYLPLKESEIVAPSDMFIIADRAGWREYDNGYPAVFIAQASASKHGGVVFGVLSRRHGKQSNITFMDGHAQVVAGGADAVSV